MEQVESEKARDLLIQKITSVLDRVLESQKTFADESLRIVVQAHVADLLWSINERRARLLFEHAVQGSETLAERTSSSSIVSGGSSYTPRSAVIRLIMTHDADWATRLIESIGDLAEVDPKLPARGLNRERVALQQQLSIYFAQRDTRRAVLAAKPFAENGDLNTLMTLLAIIRFKDAVAADELFIEALEKAKRGQPGLEDIRKFAQYVFPSFGEGVLRFSSITKSGATTSSPPVSSTTGPFLEFAFNVANKRLEAAWAGKAEARLDARFFPDYAIPKLLMPYFERLMPGRAPMFRAHLEAALRLVTSEDRPYLLLTESATVQELLSSAAAANDTKLKDALYQRAILQVSSGGDFEQAASIIESLSSEAHRSNARKTLVQRIDERRVAETWAALNKENLDKAEILSAEILNWHAQPLLVNSLIGRLARKDKSRASRMLEQYERRAADTADPNERVWRLMELTGAAASIDVKRGFEAMKSAIAEFNRAGFVPELERYRDQEATVESVNIGLGRLLANWYLSWLGQTDFDRAVALTQQFQMKEAAALALLNFCRGALPPRAGVR